LIQNTFIQQITSNFSNLLSKVSLPSSVSKQHLLYIMDAIDKLCSASSGTYYVLTLKLLSFNLIAKLLMGPIQLNLSKNFKTSKMIKFINHIHLLPPAIFSPLKKLQNIICSFRKHRSGKVFLLLLYFYLYFFQRISIPL
jgi:hypothetical protein